MKTKTTEERMGRLLQVLDDIIKDSAADEIDSVPDPSAVQTYWHEFYAIYEDPDFRHSYSMISSALSGYDPAQRDSIRPYLEEIVEFSEKQPDQVVVSKITKSLRKLEDHIELEVIRLNRMRQIEFLADQARNAQNESIALNKKTGNTVKQLENRVTGFHEQSITILGIFSAVVVGFMAELSMFTSGFNKLTSENLYTITFYSVAVGIIIFNTLFMLIFFIAEMSGHSIGKKGVSARNWLCSTWHRYPYVYCFNIFAALFLIALAFLQYTVHVIP